MPDQVKATNQRKVLHEAPESALAYSGDLMQLVLEQARRRQAIEYRWYNDTLQYFGYYDEETQSKLDEKTGASQLFVNQTRPKTRIFIARMIDILFPTDEPNWDIAATPVPRVQNALSQEQADPEKYPRAAGEQADARAIRDTAKQAAAGMKRQMADQLEQCDYVRIGTKVIAQAGKLGLGVCKGPFADLRTKEVWSHKKNPGWKLFGRKSVWSKEVVDDMRPAFEWVNAWDFYWDMDAIDMEDCEFVFQLHRYSRTDLIKRARNGFFHKDQVEELIGQAPNSSRGQTDFNEFKRYIRLLDQTYEDGTERRYDVFEYHGPVPARTLKELSEKYEKTDMLGPLGDADNMDGTVQGQVWFTDSGILKFGVNVDQRDTRPPYSIFRLDKSDGTMAGYGIPSLLRDPQRAFNAGWRMLMTNTGLAGSPMFIIDETQVTPAREGPLVIGPGEVWLRTGHGGPSATPAIEAVGIEGNSDAIISVIELAKRFCEDETNMPLVTQGDAGTGARQTAHGMSLLTTAANIIFRASARSFDSDYTIPNLKRLYAFNMLNSEDESIKGDMQVAARGHSVLLVREIRAQNLMLILNIIGTDPDIRKVFRIGPMARELVRSLQLSPVDIVLTDEEIKELMEEEAANPPKDPELERALLIEEKRSEGRAAESQLRFEETILKLASQEKMSVEQIEAKLNQIRENNAFKERLAMVDTHIKEKHGEGVLSTP